MAKTLAKIKADVAKRCQQFDKSAPSHLTIGEAQTLLDAVKGTHDWHGLWSKDNDDWLCAWDDDGSILVYPSREAADHGKAHQWDVYQMKTTPKRLPR